MKNIPRIFQDTNLKSGITIPVSREIVHYLSHVMRGAECLVFNNGDEFHAKLDGNSLIVGEKTNHTDPSVDIILYFSPIKKLDDMLNMATQMGVARFVPVIMEHTVANHINWERMKKIIVEASEQSNRNSVPSIAEPIKFSELPFSDLIFADERAAYGRDIAKLSQDAKDILIGPEGGFSDTEFKMLDDSGAHGLSLGKTILRAELAAPIAIAKILK